MMTQPQITDHLIRLNRFSVLKNQISTVLWPFYGASEDGTIRQSKVLDFSANTNNGEGLNNPDMKGLELFTDCEYLNVNGNKNLNRAANISALTKLKFYRTDQNLPIANQSQLCGDITGLTELEELYIYQGWGIYGNLSNHTKFRAITFIWFERVQGQPQQFVPPSIEKNKSLVNIYIQGAGITLDLATMVGDIAGNTSLKEISLVGFTSTTATVNAILSKCRALKQAGVGLEVVKLIGPKMGIPTGGDTNADVAYLKANNVAVSIRTA